MTRRLKDSGNNVQSTASSGLRFVRIFPRAAQPAVHHPGEYPSVPVQRPNHVPASLTVNPRETNLVVLCIVGQFVRISQSGTLRDISQPSERDGGRGVRGHITSLLTVHFNLAVILEIALVSVEHLREVVLAPDPEDLPMELAGFFE